jgi:hypothetical protein
MDIIQALRAEAQNPHREARPEVAAAVLQATMSGMPKRISSMSTPAPTTPWPSSMRYATPDIDILGISCVLGNAEVDQVVINTCKVLDAADAADIPVAVGAAQPLIERSRRQGGSHGRDGLAAIGPTAIPGTVPAPACRSSDAAVSAALLAAAERSNQGYLSHSDAAAAPVGRFAQRKALILGHRP